MSPSQCGPGLRACAVTSPGVRVLRTYYDPTLPTFAWICHSCQTECDEVTNHCTQCRHRECGTCKIAEDIPPVVKHGEALSLAHV